ncbi:MAG: tetratricopeptide repeat protein [Spirochaetota bacterium]
MKRLFLLVFFLVPALAWPLSSERELFTRAETKYYNQNYKLALETYEDFVRRFPLSDLIPDAQYKRAVCLYRVGEYHRALNLLDTITTRYRTTRYLEYVPFWKGVCFFRLQDYQNCRKQLDIFVRREIESSLVKEALFYRALSEVYLDEFAAARKTMDRLREEQGVINLSPYQVVLYSYVLFKNGAFKELIEFHEQIDPEKYPEEWKQRIYLYQAEAFWEKGRLEEAETLYLKLQEAPPEVASVAYRRLYLIAQKEKDLERMEWIIQKAEKKFSGSTDLLMDFWVRTGIESYNQKQLDISEFFLNKAWRLKETREIPEAVPSYLAEIKQEQGNVSSAVKILEEYLSSNPENSEAAAFRISELYLADENYSRAARLLRDFIQKHPHSDKVDRARYLLAYSQYKEKQYEQALENCQILERENKNSEFYDQLLRLEAIIYDRQGKIDLSYQALSAYLQMHPEDLEARVDLTKLLFAMQQYRKVTANSGTLMEQYPDLEQTDISSYLLIHYMAGLSQVALKNYNDALHNLSELSETKLSRANLVAILPYAGYYRGWSLYQLSRFQDAADAVMKVADVMQSSGFQETSDALDQLYQRALYLGGWCYFSMGRYEASREVFSRLASHGRGVLSVRALFLQGKSLVNLGETKEALEVFYRVSTDYPGSEYADDALFEQARVLEKQASGGEAAVKYFGLWKKYPESPLAGEALFKRAELFYSEEDYHKAKDAFHLYRECFTQGDLADSSLYWEAVSAAKADQHTEALMLWQKLIENYEQSPFRADSMVRSAELYVSQEEYRSALEVYSTLLEEYPQYARETKASLRQEEIRYLMFGLDRREAELTARISRQGGVETSEGRNAMIELAGLCIFEKEGKLERAYQLINQVLQKDDPATRSQAQFLLGEYYNRKGDFLKAGQEFIKVSLINPEDRDLIAHSLYRAAQMMKKAGKPREVETLVTRLVNNFPSSEWTPLGKKLLDSESSADKGPR